MTFVRSGYKWGDGAWGEESGTVYWSVDSLAGLDYDETRYDLSDFTGALQDAFDAWEEVAAIDFTYTTNDALSKFDVTTKFLSGGTIGEAYMTHTGGASPSELISAEVRFDTEEEWAPFGETDLSFYAVALHEIGHAIGLGHTSGDNGQIMYPSITSLNELGNGDKAGAQSIYGLDDGDEVVDDPDGGGSGGDDTVDGGDGGGSGGGTFAIIAMILGLIALITGSIGAIVSAAMSKDEDEVAEEDSEEEPHDHDEPLLSDFVTFTGLYDEASVETDLHQLSIDGCHDHNHCGCGFCEDCDAEQKEHDHMDFV